MSAVCSIIVPCGFAIAVIQCTSRSPKQWKFVVERCL